MKKIAFIVASVVIALTATSCTEDNIIGSSIQPDKDILDIRYATVPVVSETVFQDSVYLRNSIAVLGKFTDPTYGTVKSDYLSQLYCPYDFEFPNDVSKIDSCYLHVYYDSWFGDSAAVMHLNVWELDKNRPDNTSLSYSSTNADDYCSKTKLLGQLSFAAADFATSDSLKELSDYVRILRVPIDSMLAKKFLNDNRSHPEYFATPEAFKNYFKGIYITTDYGNGSMIYITHSELELCFDTYMYSNTSGKTLRDSLIVGGAYFPVTKEIRQINRVEHKDLKRYVQVSPDDTINYVYAPGGMFTRVTLPDSIFEPGTGRLSNSTINSFKLYVKATQLDDDWEYAMGRPESLMLIDESQSKSFFEGFNVNDGKYSFLGTYDSQTESYVFNLSYYAQKMIRVRNGETVTDFTPFTSMLLVPVAAIQNSSSETIRLEHVITPAAVKIRSSNNLESPMQLRIVYSKK
jgi:hypothetical protein